MKAILASGFATLLTAGVVAAANEPVSQLAADSALAVASLSVETVQGEVRLSGTVGNAADIQRATAVAFGVTGVKKVQNDLKSK